MALELHCKRAKIFMRQAEDGIKRVLCQPNVITKVPDWVKGTDGYKYGIKDKSIVDLTPPKVTAAVTAVEESVLAVDVADEQTGSAASAGEPSEEPSDEELEEKADGVSAAVRMPAGVVRASTKRKN